MVHPLLQRLLLVSTALLLLVSVPSQAGSIAWVVGYDDGITHAQTQQRPAFVYFQAPWCSWCHVYERDTLGDPDVATLIGRYYTPVWVNYDARPDLLEQFRGFGLPFTVILSKDGKLLTRLPGILTASDMQATLVRFAGTTSGEAMQRYEVLATVSKLDQQGYDAFLERWLDHLDDLYDTESGTFSGVLESGAGLKRPAPLAWTFMLEHDLWPERARRAVQAIRDNLYDQREGGFFYFRDPHRSDVHIETAKLLEPNALLIHWFTLAGNRYEDGRLLAAARHAISYMAETLKDQKAGGFFQAQVADADYYRNESGQVKPPALDRIKRTDTNAQAAVALLETTAITSDATSRELALETINYLLQQHLRGGELLHSISDGQPDPVTNHSIDIFWLLAAINAANQNDLPLNASSQVDQLYTLAGDWLDEAIQGSKTYPNDLLGIIAWVAAHSDHPEIPENTFSWALRQVRVQADTRPDELVFALRAWNLQLDMSLRRHN